MDDIHELQKEIAALRRLGAVDEHRYQAALLYVEDHQAEVREMLVYSSVSDVADTVIQSAA